MQKKKYNQSKMFSENFKLYQGNDVTRHTFLGLTNEKGILHISTHGIFDRQNLDELNLNDPESGITGHNIFRSCLLALSGYNESHSQHSITADAIRGLNLSGFDLVVLSACESGAGKILLSGDYSMAVAFRLAGVQNVIAVIDPIQDIIATKFAEKFYALIAKGNSYHDAFYITKAQVCPNNRIILFE